MLHDSEKGSGMSKYETTRSFESFYEAIFVIEHYTLRRIREKDVTREDANFWPMRTVEIEANLRKLCVNCKKYVQDGATCNECWQPTAQCSIKSEHVQRIIAIASACDQLRLIIGLQLAVEYGIKLLKLEQLFGFCGEPLIADTLLQLHGEFSKILRVAARIVELRGHVGPATLLRAKGYVVSDIELSRMSELADHDIAMAEIGPHQLFCIVTEGAHSSHIVQDQRSLRTAQPRRCQSRHF